MENKYLTELEQLLHTLLQREREEILQDYREHFRLAAAEGKPTEETIRSLGTPESLAAEILADQPASEPAEKKPEPSPSPLWRKLVFGGIGVLVLAAMFWVVAEVKVVRTDDTTPAADPARPATASLSPTAASSPASAVKPGGLVNILEDRSATAPIRSVRIETVDTQVVIETDKNDKSRALLEGKLTVQEGEDWTDYYEYRTETSGDTFVVTIKPTEAKKQNMPRGRSTKLRLTLPTAQLDNVDVVTVSGNVKAPVLAVAQFSGTSVSGNLDLDGLTGNKHSLINVSGKVNVGSISGDFNVESVSGSVQIAGSTWEGASSVNTVSGNINVSAEKKLPFAYELNTMSGALNCTYPDAKITGKVGKQCSGSTGDSKRTLNLTSISGSLQVGPQG